MKIEVGDLLIHYAKYGSKNYIQVEKVYKRDFIDVEEGIMYDNFYIRTTKGVETFWASANLTWQRNVGELQCHH